MIARITASLSMTVFHETISILSENQEVNNYQKCVIKNVRKGIFAVRSQLMGVLDRVIQCLHQTLEEIVNS